MKMKQTSSNKLFLCNFGEVYVRAKCAKNEGASCTVQHWPAPCRQLKYGQSWHHNCSVTRLPSAPLLPLQHTACQKNTERVQEKSSFRRMSPNVSTETNKIAFKHIRHDNMFLVFGALLSPYLVLMGFFQWLDLFLVLVVLGVESINYLETGREWDDRMRMGCKSSY